MGCGEDVLTFMLSNQRNDTEWNYLTEEDYIIQTNQQDERCGILFICPGCKEIIGIATKTSGDLPGWNISFETLTATPSILHTRPYGCGWHGYLKQGILEGKIE